MSSVAQMWDATFEVVCRKSAVVTSRFNENNCWLIVSLRKRRRHASTRSAAFPRHQHVRLPYGFVNA